MSGPRGDRLDRYRRNPTCKSARTQPAALGRALCTNQERRGPGRHRSLGSGIHNKAHAEWLAQEIGLQSGCDPGARPTLNRLDRGVGRELHIPGPEVVRLMTLGDQSSSASVVRIAAVGDLHCTRTSHGAFQTLFSQVSALGGYAAPRRRFDRYRSAGRGPHPRARSGGAPLTGHRRLRQPRP